MALCECITDWSWYMNNVVGTHYGSELEDKKYGEEVAVGKTQSGYWFYAVKYQPNDGNISRFETKEEMLKSLKSEAYLPLKVIAELVDAAEVLD